MKQSRLNPFNSGQDSNEVLPRPWRDLASLNPFNSGQDSNGCTGFVEPLHTGLNPFNSGQDSNTPQSVENKF